jgi:hypothetical protein
MEAPGALVNAALNYAVTQVIFVFILVFSKMKINFRVVMVKVYYLFGLQGMVE